MVTQLARGEGFSFITDPSSNDVLLGRGAPVVRFPGNKKYRDLLLSKKSDYTAATRHAMKDIIARGVVEEIRRRGGRFLRRVKTTEEAGALFGVEEVWEEVDDGVAVEKTKQALRDSIAHSTNEESAVVQESLQPEVMAQSQRSHSLPLYNAAPQQNFLPVVYREQSETNGGSRLLGSNIALTSVIGMGSGSVDHQRLAFIQQLQREDQERRILDSLPPASRNAVLRDIPGVYRDILPLIFSNNKLGFSDLWLLLEARNAAIRNNDTMRVAEADAVLHAVERLLSVNDLQRLRGILRGQQQQGLAQEQAVQHLASTRLADLESSTRSQQPQPPTPPARMHLPLSLGASLGAQARSLPLAKGVAQQEYAHNSGDSNPSLSAHPRPNAPEKKRAKHN